MTNGTCQKQLGPLAGLNVIDLSHVMAGPTCAMFLADMGADVIKVEKIPGGDDLRRSVPPVALGSAVAEAAEVNLNVDSPAIRAVKGSRKARYPQLKPYLDKGILGEGKSGLIVIRSPEGLDARTRVTLKQLMDAENQDRMNLFSEFNRINNLNDVRAIQKQFARAIREELSSGHWYKDDSGKWTQKP